MYKEEGLFGGHTQRETQKMDRYSIYRHTHIRSIKKKRGYIETTIFEKYMKKERERNG